MQPFKNFPLVSMSIAFCAFSLLSPSESRAQASGSSVSAPVSSPPAVQTNSAANAPAKTPEYRPGAGTQILGELIKPLEVNRLKVGDSIECRLIQDLLFQGKIVIPRKARAWGHVTEVVLPTKENPGSRVGLVFDKIVLPDKKELPFQHPAIVVALAAPMRTNTVNTNGPSNMPILMSKGQDTGASMVDAIGANSQLAGANMPSAQGAISSANRGVIGIKGVTLDNSNTNYSVISVAKGKLNLDFDVQILLQVTDGSSRPK